jgi:hypothetical protein
MANELRALLLSSSPAEISFPLRPNNLYLHKAAETAANLQRDSEGIKEVGRKCAALRLHEGTAIGKFRQGFADNYPRLSAICIYRIPSVKAANAIG